VANTELKDYLIAITRVNVVKKWDKPDPEALRHWLDTRIGFIRRFPAHSVRMNYEKPHRWLVLVNLSAFSADQLVALKDALRDTPYCLVDTKGGKIITAIQDALSDLSYPCRITTSRFDSDDIISNDFFAGIKNHLLSGKISRYPALISYPGGATYVERQNKFYMSAYPDNPFLSLVEEVHSAEDIRTVYFKMHTNIREDVAEVFMLRSNHPMWASVVQGDNVANESLLAGCEITLEGQALSKRFGFDDDTSLTTS